MGSGRTRRKKDVVHIKRPKLSVVVDGKGGGGATGGAEMLESALNCPTHLQVIVDSTHVSSGESARLTKSGDSLVVVVGRATVGTLGKKESEKLIKCLGSGFRYVGKITDGKGGKLHAEFVREP
jgi:hypothetical protein